MLPITGPFVSMETGYHWKKTITRWRQKPPFDRPLPYDVDFIFGEDYGEVRDLEGQSSVRVANYGFSVEGNMPNYGTLKQHAINQAMAKLNAAIGDQAGMAENLAQFGKTVEMINDRLVQTWTFVNHLRHGRFGDAARALKVPKPQSVSPAQGFAKNFLEYSYGWAPLLSDISSGTKILTETDFLPRRVSGTAKEYAATGSAGRTGDGNNGSVWSKSSTYSIRCQCLAWIKVNNPNLFLAGRMGAIDPALPWKLVPYSFVVDWFVNVEQVLSACTMFLGVEVSRSCHSLRLRGSVNDRTQSWEQYWSFPQQTHATRISLSTRQQSAQHFWRQVGLPSIQLVVRPFTGFSLNRGLQALSLVIAGTTSGKSR